MSDYKNLLKPFLKDVEGYEEEPYLDSKGNPTIGAGLNLKDPEVRGLFELRDYNPDEIIDRKRLPSSEILDEVKDSYLDRRQDLVKSKVGPDLYEMLPANKKAALMSLGYQSLNNIGPSLTGHLASDDTIGAIREMMLRTNKDQDPGTMVRRLKEAELYGGPVDFSSTFKTLTPEERKSVLDTLDRIENPHTKAQVLEKYKAYLDSNNNPKFNKLNKLLTPEINPLPLVKKP